MEKQQKKRIRKYIVWVLIVAMVALLAVLPMVAGREEVADGPQASILSDTAALRDITAKVMGGGTLTGQDPVEITIPAAVKLTEYLVKNGDLVEEGQEIAIVDRVTVMTAITQVQETLEDLATQINKIRTDSAADTVTAQAAGTVKALYAQPGENVQDVMLRDGALAVLSLDGLMAVQVQRNTNLSGGDTVCVTLSDGTEAEGRVESNLEGILTVTVEDAGYPVGDSVKVTTEDGSRIGSGTLYIHNQWNAVAYSGTVSRVRVSEGSTVAAGRTLFNLENTGHAAQFETLSQQHREYEELMLELFQMYQSQRLTAPTAGMVTGVDESGTYMLSDSGNGYRVTLLANAPNGNDETSYLNYVGQVQQVGIDGLILKMYPHALSITDYKDLSGVPLDPALMTEDAIYNAWAPIYQLSGEEWVQISSSSIAPGDMLLFASDSSGFVWVVRVASGTVVPEEPTEPPAPTEPSTPTDPANPEDPTTPTESGKPGGNISLPSGGGSRPSGGNLPSGGSQSESSDLYSLDTLTVASVTPQETVTIQITVDELDISKLYPGQAASVTVNALKGRTFDATITEISASGENEGGNSKFTVTVTMEKEADMLSGMNASVSVTTHTEEQVLCVPVAALVEDGGQTILYTGYDGENEVFTGSVAVTVGASDGEYAEIRSGISQGQTIYYPYYDTLVISNAPESGGFPFG